MSDDLDTKTDRELDELFAVEVAGWQHRLATRKDSVERAGFRLPNYFGPPIEAWWTDNDPSSPAVYAWPPKYTTDANAVLPWLAKFTWEAQGHAPGFGHTCRVWLPGSLALEKYAQIGTAPTFPRAAVIALLRAKRAEKAA